MSDSTTPINKASSPLSVIDITAQTIRRLVDEERAREDGDAYLCEELRLVEAHLNNASRHLRWRAVQEEEQRDLEASLEEEGK